MQNKGDAHDALAPPPALVSNESRRAPVRDSDEEDSMDNEEGEQYCPQDTYHYARGEALDVDAVVTKIKQADDGAAAATAALNDFHQTRLKMHKNMCVSRCNDMGIPKDRVDNMALQMVADKELSADRTAQNIEKMVVGGDLEAWHKEDVRRGILNLKKLGMTREKVVYLLNAAPHMIDAASNKKEAVDIMGMTEEELEEELEMYAPAIENPVSLSAFLWPDEDDEDDDESEASEESEDMECEEEDGLDTVEDLVRDYDPPCPSMGLVDNITDALTMRQMNSVVSSKLNWSNTEVAILEHELEKMYGSEWWIEENRKNIYEGICSAFTELQEEGYIRSYNAIQSKLSKIRKEKK